MAQRKLQPDHRNRTMMTNISTVCLMALLTLLQGCVHVNDNVGMTLLFTNKGPYSIGVLRFDQDGQRGPTPGAIGVGGSAQMAFMAGDSKRGVPKFVDVQWMVATPSYELSWKSLKVRPDKYSKAWMSDVDEVNSQAPHHTRRVDLAPILTPELLAKVRANPSTTHIKLTVVFKDDTASITAESEIWRK